MRKNQDLKKYYNKAFSKKNRIRETSEFNEILKQVNWKGKKVLDVGCGTGEFAFLAAKKGAKILGIDFSKTAIKHAQKKFKHPNLMYKNIDVDEITREKYDIIVSVGTLEHMNKPFNILKKFKQNLSANGKIIITSPNWANPRGFILMTLYYLFNAPITLADLHYLSPIDFQKWAKKLDMNIKWKTIEQSWAHGEKLITDLKERLPNVLLDTGLPKNPKNIQNFLKWIDTKILPLDNTLPHSGAIGLYLLSKKNKSHSKN